MPNEEIVLKYYGSMVKVTILVCSMFVSSLQADVYTAPLSKHTKSGMEVRLNALYSSGRFVQNITETDPLTNREHEYERTSDLTTKGFSVLLGYAREYRKQDQSSFLYIGYENQRWNDAYDSRYHAFIVGLEGGVGSAAVKFIYGGEFAFGALDTGEGGLGYLKTFTAEPYLGLRFFSQHGVTLNLRAGVRAYTIEGVREGNVKSSNSAYSGNVQLGLGYQFF